MARYFLALMAISLTPTVGLAVSLAEQVDAAGNNGQYTYVMFYRVNDDTSQKMASTVESHVTTTNGATAWVRVNVEDDDQTSLIERFDASRMPLPAVVTVAPNGAVSGIFRQTVSSAQLNNAILTPKYSEMVKALQSQKIAVVCLKPAATTSTPESVETLQAMPAFQGKMHQVVADATDSAESEFFRRMKVDRNLDQPVVLMFAPPGNYLGTFPATTSAMDLAKALHNTGKCTCHECKAKRATNTK